MADEALVVRKMAPHVAPLAVKMVKRQVVRAEGLEDRSYQERAPAYFYACIRSLLVGQEIAVLVR